MIIVLGSVVAKPDTLPALLKASQERVERSRKEPGCIAHAVHIDHGNPLKLVFVEKRADASALATHFKVKGSIDFVGHVRAHAASAPVIEIFAATPQAV